MKPTEVQLFTVGAICTATIILVYAFVPNRGLGVIVYLALMAHHFLARSRQESAK